MQDLLCPAGEPEGRAHVDLLVDDLDEADARVVALGARRLTVDAVVHDDESFRVYADPAGHPFCLIVQADPDLVNEIRSVLEKESARTQ